MLQTVEVNPAVPPRSSVIWMHGLGADGYDFADIIPQLNLPEELAIHFVFPHAPMRHVTMAAGAKMRAWYDIGKGELNSNFYQDEIGIREAQQLIEQIVAAELARGIDSSRIVLVGFSQGGAMALQCGLRYPKQLAGILVLSSWLPLANTVMTEKHASNQNVPILMLHGTMDELVPLPLAQQSCEKLKNMGFNIQLQTYPMPHSVCGKEIVDIAQWLKQILG